MWLSPKSNFKEAIAFKVIEPALLRGKVGELRKQKKTIATLNGSFDLMHAGHLEIIYQASCQADVLIVALNTDSSIQRYKNPLRPIIPLEYRIEMMAGLAMVDYVTWFDETDPCKVLSLIQPDVHVNGAEYTEQCIEAETVRSCGGRLHLVHLVPGLSTSKIIKKIVTTCA
jgi:rfaE bifunctional protein nucleotidyltransferase chain/domain